MEKIYCPANDWHCPYFKKDGSCGMVDEGNDPRKECDETAWWWEDEDDNIEFYIIQGDME